MPFRRVMHPSIALLGALAGCNAVFGIEPGQPLEPLEAGAPGANPDPVLAGRT